MKTINTRDAETQEWKTRGTGKFAGKKNVASVEELNELTRKSSPAKSVASLVS